MGIQHCIKLAEFFPQMNGVHWEIGFIKLKIIQGSSLGTSLCGISKFSGNDMVDLLIAHWDFSVGDIMKL
jgi:hypothetical protein